MTNISIERSHRSSGYHAPKERVMARLERKCKYHSTCGLDFTRPFSTREVKRLGTQIEAARHKRTKALKLRAKLLPCQRVFGFTQ